jgi:hypothetical protein
MEDPAQRKTSGDAAAGAEGRKRLAVSLIGRLRLISGKRHQHDFSRET